MGQQRGEKKVLPPDKTAQRNTPAAVEVAQHLGVELVAPAGHVCQGAVPDPVALRDHAAHLVDGLLQGQALGEAEDVDEVELLAFDLWGWRFVS